MHRLVEFFRRIYVVLIFLLLEGIAIWQYASSSPYTEAKIYARTTTVGGAVSDMVTDVAHFFSLPEENRLLCERVAQLEAEGERMRRLLDSVMLDSLASQVESDAMFKFHAARVSSSTSNRKRNYVVLDRGAKDGVAVKMGVMTPERHLVGYVSACSEHYAVVEPIINTKFSTGGYLVDNEGNPGYCSVTWDGSSRYHADASDISVNVTMEEGLIIEVRSERMPEGVVIGEVESFKLNNAKTAYSSRIKLAADLSALDNVIIVEGIYAAEVDTIMDSAEE